MQPDNIDSVATGDSDHGSSASAEPRSAASPSSEGGRGAGQHADFDRGGNEQLVAAARSGNHGYRFGEDRAITNPPNWASQDTHQLYNGAINNNDPGTVDATGQAWKEHGAALKDAANTLFDSISELGHAWIGQAAGAAQGTLASIAKSSDAAAEAAQAMGVRMTEQAAAAAEVKKMPPPEEFSQEEALAALLHGGPEAMTADIKAQSDAARNVKEQQVAYCNAYTTALADTDDKTPSFGPESLALKPVTDSGSAASSGIGGYGTGIGLTGGDTASSAASAGGVDIGRGQQPAGAPGGQAPAHAPAQQAPAGISGGPASAAGQASASGSGGLGAGAAAGGAALGAGLGLGGAKARATGNRSAGKKQEDLRSADAAGRQGAAPGDEATGATDPAAPDSAAGTANPAAGGSAPGSQGGPHHHGAGGPGGAVPPAGAPMGAAGAGGAGTAGGSAGSEEEHTRESFLIEPDPDELFGPGEAVNPPVIGLVDEDE